MSADLPGPLKVRDGEPLFDEPWQAQSLAIASGMVEAGYFTAQNWAEALGAEIRRSAAAGAPDDQASYYAAVLRALEGLTAARELVTGADLADRTAAWVRAYERTPHGQPVELEAGRKDGGSVRE